MRENQAIRWAMRAHRAGHDASAQTVGGPTTGKWAVHLDHGRRIFEDARECGEEICRLRVIKLREEAR